MSPILEFLNVDTVMGFAGAFIGAGLGLLGVVIANRSSLSRLRLQLKYEQKRDYNRLKQERLEELYILLSHWMNAFFSSYLRLVLVMKGEIDYNQYLDQFIADGADKNVDFQRIEMIIYLHAKELMPEYKNVLKCREKLNDIVSVHKAEYQKGVPNGTHYIAPYTRSLHRLDEAVQCLKNKIADMTMSP